jgi:hypothetical protein
MEKSYDEIIYNSSFTNKKAMKSGSVIKENSHRYKQDVEKYYIYQQFVNKEKKVKQNEKIQEVY